MGKGTGALFVEEYMKITTLSGNGLPLYEAEAIAAIGCSPDSKLFALLHGLRDIPADHLDAFVTVKEDSLLVEIKAVTNGHDLVWGDVYRGDEISKPYDKYAWGAYFRDRILQGVFEAVGSAMAAERAALEARARSNRILRCVGSVN